MTVKDKSASSASFRGQRERRNSFIPTCSHFSRKESVPFSAKSQHGGPGGKQGADPSADPDTVQADGQGIDGSGNPLQDQSLPGEVLSGGHISFRNLFFPACLPRLYYLNFSEI